MVRLDPDIAVIGLINHLLRTHEEPELDFDKICAYTRSLEDRTGLAVLHGFTPEGLRAFLALHPDLFESRSGGKFRFSHAAYDAALFPEYIDRIVAGLVNRLDPRMNYPMRLLEVMLEGAISRENEEIASCLIH